MPQPSFYKRTAGPGSRPRSNQLGTTFSVVIRSLAWAMVTLATTLGPRLAGAQDGDKFQVFRIFLDESRIEEFPGLKRMSVTNPAVADVVIVGPEEVRLDGRRVGRTSLYYWDKVGRHRLEIVVIDRRDDLAAQISEAINLPEVVVEVVNGRAVLKGWVQNAAEQQTAVELARVYVGNVIDLMQIKGKKVFDPQQEIETLLNLPEVKVTVIMDPRSQLQDDGRSDQDYPPIAAVILEGFVADQRDRDRAQAIAQTFSTNIQNFIEIISPIQVMIQAHILELSKNAATQFGFNWGTQVIDGVAGGPITVPNTTPTKAVRFIENVFNSPHGQGTFFGAKIDQTNAFPWEFENLNRLDPLGLVINWLVNNSKGRVLANPKVVTRSGAKAEINVGGEFPYPQNAGLGETSTAFKNFGITLGIGPEVDHKGNINTTLDIDVSTPDFGRAQLIGGVSVPPLTRRTTKSEVSVKDGEHIVVSGLLSENNSKSFDKVPYLHRLPVIGNMFNSKSFNDSKQEVVVIVTPNILAPADQQQQFASVRANEEMKRQKGRADEARIPVDQKPNEPQDTSIWALQADESVETIPASLPNGPSGDESARERVQMIMHGMKRNQEFHEQVNAAYGEGEQVRPQYKSPVPWDKTEINWQNNGALERVVSLPSVDAEFRYAAQIVGSEKSDPDENPDLPPPDEEDLAYRAYMDQRVGSIRVEPTRLRQAQKPSQLASRKGHAPKVGSGPAAQPVKKPTATATPRRATAPESGTAVERSSLQNRLQSHLEQMRARLSSPEDAKVISGI